MIRQRLRAQNAWSEMSIMSLVMLIPSWSAHISFALALLEFHIVGENGKWGRSVKDTSQVVLDKN